jgi:hypothetical protein
LTERRIAAGTMAAMVKRVMHEMPAKRREFIIMHEGMEFRSAEIQNLAGQYAFSEANLRGADKPVMKTWLRASIKVP